MNTGLTALITARGGSKGLPGKNIKDMNGKPMIAYTIEAAKNSKYVDRIILSTDDEEIAQVAKQYGAEVPFIRPSELANDEASSKDVIMHTLKYLEAVERKTEYFVLLQPTSPLRTSQHIDEAYEALQKGGDDALISVYRSKSHPLWMHCIEDEYLTPFLSQEQSVTRRQDLSDIYCYNGAIYICKWDDYVKYQSFTFGKTRPFIMSEEDSVDIDTITDFKFAELLLKEKANA